ncbi:MAG: hypothetical protein M3317_03700 [Actinomycetota bacterium]|nr:hypothetical protein [Actinomycetota bacterium]
MVAMLIGVRSYRPEPVLPRYVIALGVVLFVVGDVVFFNFYPNVLEVRLLFPSVADVFYASSYLLVVLGVALLIRSTGSTRNWGGLVDAQAIEVAAHTLKEGALTTWELNGWLRCAGSCRTPAYRGNLGMLRSCSRGSKSSSGASAALEAEVARG